MAVVDASVWIAAFIEGDAFRQQARHIFQSLSSRQEKIYLPAIALTEVAGAIKRITKNNKDARDALLNMKDLEPEILIDFGELEPIASEIAINHSIRGADACYLAVAEITRSELYTFDKEQQKAFEEMSKIW